MGYLTVCDCDLCDCDHNRSEHAGVDCKECADTWSPDGGCRAGGFTNSEVRLTMLTEFLNRHPCDVPDCIQRVTENVEGGSSASTIPVETPMAPTVESYEEREQEAGLLYAGPHN